MILPYLLPTNIHQQNLPTKLYPHHVADQMNGVDQTMYLDLVQPVQLPDAPRPLRHLDYCSLYSSRSGKSTPLGGGLGGGETIRYPAARQYRRALAAHRRRRHLIHRSPWGYRRTMG